VGATGSQGAVGATGATGPQGATGPGSTPGGPQYAVQLNNPSGTLYGDVNFTYNPANKTLGLSGATALYTVGSHNWFLGEAGTLSLSTGGGNVGIGVNSLYAVTTGSNNIAIGGALLNCTTGVQNVAIGNNSLGALLSGQNNLAIGTSCLSQATGDGNVGIGLNAGSGTTTGQYNVAIGYQPSTGGTYSMGVAIGFMANAAGGSGIAVGYYAGGAGAGPNGTCVGASAGYNLNGGQQNTLIGSGAGYVLTTGNNNTIIGYNAASANLTTGSSNLILGDNVLTGGSNPTGAIVIGCNSSRWLTYNLDHAGAWAAFAPIYLPADPTVALQAATKQYVDAHAGGGGLSDAPSDGTLYGRLNAAWAAAYPASNPSNYIAASGAPVQSVATRTGAITLTHTDITDWTTTLAPYAPIASPTFTGTPAAPTATAGTSTTQLATTAFVAAALTALPAGVTSFNTRTGAVTLATADVTGAGGAPLASPTFTGTVTIPSGASISGYAPLASPTFTGTPAAPTAAIDTNTTQVATTAYVIAQASASGDGTPAMNGTAARGTSTHWTRADHIHPVDTSRAPLASPTFTGTVTIPSGASISGYALLASPTFTGVPAAPTAAANTNTTQLATTAYVIGQASSTTPAMDGAAAVGTGTTWARADHVHPTDTTRAPLASPTFTGTPAAPNAALNTNTTQLATTAFVLGQVSTTTPAMDGAAAVGTGTTFARADHVHPSDTSRAPLASPTFTGTPAAPTAASGTNTTQVATTAYVQTTTIPSGNVQGQDADFSASITLAASDNGKIKNCTSTAAVNVTLPNTLPKDFYCTIHQASTGQITFVAGAGAVLNNRQGLLHSAGQYAMCSIIAWAVGVFTLGGDCA